MEESRGWKKPHLADKKSFRVGASSSKGKLHREGRQVPKRRGKVSRKNLSGGKSRKHDRVSGRHNFSGGPGESIFHSNLDKHKVRKEDGRQKLAEKGQNEVSQSDS